MGGGLLIDTQFDLAHATQMARLFGQIWRGPPARVVNTHEHAAHTWGNQLFPQADVLAHRPSPERPALERPEDWQRLRDAIDSPHPGIAARARALRDFDFAGIVSKGANTVFDTRVELRLDGTEAHLIYAGPAHSDGDTLVYLPNEDVLFAGDVVCRDLTPVVTGSFSKWLSVLDHILDLQPALIVPGHGPVCGVEAVFDCRCYLRYVWLESEHHFRAGRSVLDAAKRIELGAYALWAEPERLYFNVAQAWRELSERPLYSTDPTTALQHSWELRCSWDTGSGERADESTDRR